MSPSPPSVHRAPCVGTLRIGKRLSWPDDYSRLYLGYRLEEVEYRNFDPEYTDPYGLKEQTWPQTTSSLQTTYLRDSRDLPEFPTAGSVTSYALELAGAARPKADKAMTAPAKPGLSLVPAFAGDRAVNHRALWWCHSGNRAIRIGDWKLSAKGGEESKWELYDLTVDRCEMNDLASEYPQRVRHLGQQWENIADGFRKNLTNKNSL